MTFLKGKSITEPGRFLTDTVEGNPGEYYNLATTPADWYLEFTVPASRSVLLHVIYPIQPGTDDTVPTLNLFTDQASPLGFQVNRHIPMTVTRTNGRAVAEVTVRVRCLFNAGQSELISLGWVTEVASPGSAVRVGRYDENGQQNGPNYGEVVLEVYEA